MKIIYVKDIWDWKVVEEVKNKLLICDYWDLVVCKESDWRIEKVIMLVRYKENEKLWKLKLIDVIKEGKIELKMKEMEWKVEMKKF